MSCWWWWKVPQKFDPIGQSLRHLERRNLSFSQCALLSAWPEGRFQNDAHTLVSALRHSCAATERRMMMHMHKECAALCISRGEDHSVGSVASGFCVS